MLTPSRGRNDRVAMQCNRARLVLWPQPGKHPTGHADELAFVHYVSCPACQRFLRMQRALGRRLKALQRATAPPDLAQRIRNAIAADAAQRARAARWRTALLAATAPALLLAATAALVLVLRPGSDRGRFVVPLVAQAQQDLGDLRGYIGSNAVEVERWLRNNLGHAVSVPLIADAEVVGARVVLLDGMPAGAVVYAYHGVPLTYFALSGEEVMGKRITSPEVMAVAAGRFHVALWNDRGRARALVAAMAREEVIAIARQCLQKAQLRRLTA